LLPCGFQKAEQLRDITIMIYSRSAVNERDEFNYREEFRWAAVEKIKQYPTLHDILGDFPNYDADNYDSNYIFVMASTAKNDVFKNGPNPESEMVLQHLEVILKHLKIKDIKKETRNKIISDLNSFDEVMNHGIVTELLFYRDLVLLDGIESVDYCNNDGNRHDFNVKIKGVTYNIELTRTTKGKVQRIVEESFDLAAKEIILKIPDNMLLKLNINSSMILRSSENDSNEIAKTILDQFQIISPLIFADKNNYCHLHKNFGSKGKSLIEISELFEYYDELGKRLQKLCNTNEGIEFLEKTKSEVISESSIVSFFYGDARAKLIKIATESHWPSIAESKRKKSLVKQIRKGVEEKIKKGQLKGKVNPIIAIKVTDWVFHGYSTNEYFGEEHFGELNSIVQSVFSETNNCEILGVLFYSEHLTKSRVSWNMQRKWISAEDQIKKIVEEINPYFSN